MADFDLRQGIRTLLEQVLDDKPRRLEPVLISQTRFDQLTEMAKAGDEQAKAWLRICKVQPLCQR